jgi:hypothetical protein
MLQPCASLCLENAQKMIALAQEYHKPDESIGLMPWRHRVLYLHVAGTTLIAATLRADLFTSSISQSWNMAMAALHAHEHFSPFVQQCVATFQTLSARILETHHRFIVIISATASSLHRKEVLRIAIFKMRFRTWVSILIIFFLGRMI